MNTIIIILASDTSNTFKDAFTSESGESMKEEGRVKLSTQRELYAV
jgi:hypothetical protein